MSELLQFAQDKQEVLKKFEEECEKFEKYEELYHDPVLQIRSNAQQELEEFKIEYGTEEGIKRFNEECSGITTFEETIKDIEEAIFYNKTVDDADLIYAEILRLGKLIAVDHSAFGFERAGLTVKIYNMGIIKSDIDDEKEFNEEIVGRQVYPIRAKVKVILDEQELEKFLFE